MAQPPKYLMPILVTRDEEDLGGVELICENLWPEDPSEGSPVPYLLHNPPGAVELTKITTAGGSRISTSITGIFQQSGIFDGDLFLFWNNQVTRTTATSPLTGNITGSEAMAMTFISGSAFTTNSADLTTQAAAIRGYVSWVDAAYTAHVYDGSTAISVVDLPTTIGDVTSLAKRFVWIDIFTDTVYYSDLGLGTFNAANFFTAETISDKLKSCYAHSNRLYLGGDLTTEIWVPSPDYELPFAYSGVTMALGSVSPASWADTGEFVGMVGTQKNALGVYAIRGASYEKISPNWLDRRLTKLSESDRRKIQATAYTIEGHATYELHIPGDGASLKPLSIAFDILKGAWYKVSDPDGTNLDAKRWVGQLDSTIIVARAFGDVGAVTRSTVRYFGNIQRRIWSFFQSTERRIEQNEVVQQMQFMDLPASGIDGDRLTLADKAEINAAGGVIYRWSDSMGVDFRDDKALTVNRHNKFGHKVASRRGGELRQPGRVHQFECTQDFNIEVGPLFVNAEVLIS